MSQPMKKTFHFTGHTRADTPVRINKIVDLADEQAAVARIEANRNSYEWNVYKRFTVLDFTVEDQFKNRRLSDDELRKRVPEFRRRAW